MTYYAIIVTGLLLVLMGAMISHIMWKVHTDATRDGYAKGYQQACKEQMMRAQAARIAHYETERQMLRQTAWMNELPSNTYDDRVVRPLGEEVQR